MKRQNRIWTVLPAGADIDGTVLKGTEQPLEISESVT
jgi:hypothetical protein